MVICTTLSVTGTETHKACVNNICTTVTGVGANECSTVGVACTHKVCWNNVCTALDGPGTNECTTIGTACGIVLSQISIPSTKSIVKNNSVIITATCKDTTGAGMTCPTLTWTASNNNVMLTPWGNNVDCTITGVSVGTSVVTTSGGGKTSNSCTVTVTESAGILNQIIIASSIPIVKGNTGSVSVSCKDTLGYNMTCPTLTWTSSNTSIATVVGGMITGVGVGICIVKATGGGKTSNDCIVSVTSPGCTNPKYKCYGTPSTCISDNCDGTGTFPDANCGTGCGGTGIYYKCENNVCNTKTGIGTSDCTPGVACGGGGICSSDQIKDASGNCVCIDQNKMNIFGTCYKKNDIYMAVGAVALLLILTKK